MKHKNRPQTNRLRPGIIMRKISKGYSMFHGFVPNLGDTASEPFSFGCDLAKTEYGSFCGGTGNGSPRS